jgi:hypothetical protein
MLFFFARLSSLIKRVIPLTLNFAAPTAHPFFHYRPICRLKFLSPRQHRYDIPETA